MRLIHIRVQRFRNFVDAQDIVVEPDVTALVGKNESGKTTVLQALHRLKPANLRNSKFNLTTEYPRWRLSRDKKADPALEKSTRPIEAWFSLDDADLAAFKTAFSVTLPKTTQCWTARNYVATTRFQRLVCPLGDVIAAAADAASVDAQDRNAIGAAANAEEAKSAARDLAKRLKESGEAARAKALGAFPGAIDKYEFLLGGTQTDEQYKAIGARLPSFFYFSDYDLLPGEHDLTDLASKLTAGTDLTPDEESVAALLAYANTTASDFLGEDYEARKAELQASALDLTRKVFDYWTQNRDLEVEFDTELEEVGTDSRGNPILHRILKVLMRDLRHGGISTSFETRSAGFRWFFSFLAAFSRYQESPDPMVVLLDEPGTSLHGEAQKDFLRFIFDELGASKQVIYTTHSQYMVDPAKFEKLRAVEDRSTRENPDLGVAVTDVAVSADQHTLLPIQAALGYSMSQHLFLGAGRHLTVEGGSDFIYLQRMSEHLASKGRVGLDPRLAIIPLGSASHTPAFVALFARHVRVSVLLDGDQNGKDAARVYGQAAKGLLKDEEIVVIGEVPGIKARKPDIEDLFHEADYVRLYNWAFGTKHKASDLSGSEERVIARLEALDAAFDHALPAYALTEHLDEFFASVKDVTLDRFEELMKLLNATISSDE
jgi:predicted ATP-dependent endonuclease of OLD family